MSTQTGNESSPSAAQIAASLEANKTPLHATQSVNSSYVFVWDIRWIGGYNARLIHKEITNKIAA